MKSEGGRVVDGAVFQDQPWIVWERAIRCALCERCGVVSEIPVPFIHAALSQKLRKFWELHRGCGRAEVTGDPPRLQGEPVCRVQFPVGNTVLHLYGDRTSGRLVVTKGVGIPPDVAFEVRDADPSGAWLYAPGYGLEPDEFGPIRVYWEREVPDAEEDDAGDPSGDAGHTP